MKIVRWMVSSCTIFGSYADITIPEEEFDDMEVDFHGSGNHSESSDDESGSSDDDSDDMEDPDEMDDEEADDWIDEEVEGFVRTKRSSFRLTQL